MVLTGLGRRIKAARKSRELTGEKLAEICHINATYLRQIEAGVKVPSLYVFVSLCNALQTSPTYMLMDTISENELSQFDSLAALWKGAAPCHIALVSTMIAGALTYLKNQ